MLEKLGFPKSLTDLMVLVPSFLCRCAPDSTSRITHSFLSTRRSNVSIAYRAGPGKSKQGGLKTQADGTASPLNRSGTHRVLKFCTVQVIINIQFSADAAHVLPENQLPAGAELRKTHCALQDRAPFLRLPVNACTGAASMVNNLRLAGVMLRQVALLSLHFPKSQ